MKIEGEEVEPVQAFDELTPGVVLWIVGCCVCGNKHRGMIGGIEPGEGMHRGHLFAVFLPKPACVHTQKAGLLEGDPFRDGDKWIVYRVVEGLPDRVQDEEDRRSIEYGAEGYAKARQRSRYAGEMYRIGRFVGEFHRDLQRKYGIE
jgi:hypothetical protein